MAPSAADIKVIQDAVRIAIQEEHSKNIRDMGFENTRQMRAVMAHSINQYEVSKHLSMKARSIILGLAITGTFSLLWIAVTSIFNLKGM